MDIMSVFKITGPMLDTSGEVAKVTIATVLFVRAATVTEAKAIWARVSGYPYWDKITLQVPGDRAAQDIGSPHVYDRIASPTHGDGISDPAIDMAALYHKACYRPTSRAQARSLNVNHLRAQRGADKALAKLGKRIAAMQREAGIPVHVTI